MLAQGTTGPASPAAALPAGRWATYGWSRWLPVLVGCASAAAYLAWRQAWLFGDGYDQVRVLSRAAGGGELPVWRHVLYLPLARILAAAPLHLSPRDACLAISALSGGALVGCCHALARRVAGERVALLVALVAATSPAVWFFATTVEVHALQGAVAALGAAAVLHARGRARLLISGAAIAACFLAHESSWLLVPGWVLLTALPAHPVRPANGASGAAHLPGARAVARAAAVVVAGAAVGIGGAALAKHVGTGAGELSAMQLVAHLRSAPDLARLWSGAVAPHLGLFALACLGLRRRDLPVFLAFVVPHAAFVVLVFADPNQGGYLMPVVWLLAAPAARALATRRGVAWLALLLLVLQVHAARALTATPGQDSIRAVRAARTAAAAIGLPGGGLVLSADLTLQTIEGELPGLHELNLWRDLAASAAREEPSGAFAQRVLDLLPALAERHGALAIDLSFESQLAPHPAARERMDALVRRVSESRPTHPVERDGVRLLVVGL